MEKKKGCLHEFGAPQCLREWMQAHQLPNAVAGRDPAPWLTQFLHAAMHTIPRLVLHRPWQEGAASSVVVIGEWITPHVERVVPVCLIKLERDYSDIVFVRDSDSWLISVNARGVPFPVTSAQFEKKKYAACTLPAMYMARPSSDSRRGGAYTLHIRHRASPMEFLLGLGRALGVSRLSDD